MNNEEENFRETSELELVSTHIRHQQLGMQGIVRVNTLWRPVTEITCVS